MKVFKYNKLTYAFTMIELVFVIIIVGIISVMIAPSFGGNNTRQAADQIISHLRYTQHLAMQDNKYDPANQNWYKNRWNIDLNTTNPTNSTYSISFERYKNNGTNDGVKYASNPLVPTQALNANEMEELNLSEKYGVTITNNCSTNKIFFDDLGRPYDANSTATAPYQNLIRNICTIVLHDENPAKNITIQLQPETGYVRINP